MSSIKLNLFRHSLLLAVALLLGLPGLTQAAILTGADFASVPPTNVLNTTNATPLVMLLLGKDDALYRKAYTDLVDLTGSGTINTTYDNSFAYYGYFNSDMCYTYDAGNKYFTPAVSASNHTCDGSANKYWSGNFLNWATMTRMDILRKVLYGGYRSTDTSTQTVLERAYFPTDGHSFAKYYNGSDLGDLTPYNGKTTAITICNTTDSASGVMSQTDTDPPLMRVANGDFRHWAANERWQCTWQAEHSVKANSPNDNAPDKTNDGLTNGSNGPDYVVRVDVCDAGVLNGPDCTQYPDKNYKPTGLLQTYGENGQIKFGLMTGSYTLSKSGGVLRKNISDFSNEVNAATDGTFTGVSGIVSTINDLRMHGYEYNSGVYNGSSDDNCPWGLSSFTEPSCSNWGNPMSEMYLEAVRYFHDDNASTSFNTDDSKYIPGVNGSPGLSTATWSHPLNANNYCAQCSIIVLNTGPFSYDSDQIDTGFSDLTNSTTAEALTKQIGDWENITGNSYFIGNNGTTNDGLCTAKVINDLSQAIGPCPDEPRLGGSFEMAGIAYWAHTNNLNPDAPSGHSQTINTYTVNLSSTTPIINIPVPGSTTQTVKLMPACQDKWGSSSTASSQTPGDCRIVDMQITSPYTLDATGNTATGTIYVNYDDSEQGGDFDQDMWGTIQYSITSTDGTTGTITITTQVDYQSTPYRMGFGYVISGTDSDGFHVHSGINNYSYTDPDTSIAHCSGCYYTDAATSQIYTLGTTSAGILKDPLWYTAKYGGFDDSQGTHTISSQDQWDKVNNSTGVSNPDGVPDNYYTSVDPGQLQANLSRVLANITERVSSGTAAAVISNSGTGTGMLVQALYQPKMTAVYGQQTDQITWGGRLYSLFLDQYGNLREDANIGGGTPGKLDNYTEDPIVTLEYDSNTNTTGFHTWSTPDGGITKSATAQQKSLLPLSQLHTIWSARDQLANITDPTTQRTYGQQIDAAHSRRYIFTAIDNNNDGKINNTDVINFDTTDMDKSTNYDWLDIQTDLNNNGTVNDLGDANDLVNFIRGEEKLDNFRKRTIDYDNDSKEEVWRLGDIVHSTPLIVGPPSDDWDAKYGDNTYTTFRNDYSDRRVVVYVGANDGMLHAFNGGFYDSTNKQYDLTRAINPKINETVAPAADPLGSELWAYVPSNLLPHLQWLTEKNYPHVYYVDGSPQTFDVNIFDSNSGSGNYNSIGASDGMDHPGGWGTILVVGMRLGGSPITYTPVPGRTVTSRSAFMIFDVTNPEHVPVLLGEISDPPMNTPTPASGPILGFTTSAPSLIVKRSPSSSGDWSNPSVNKWYLVFGSGPNNLSDVSSSRDAGLYILNLDTMDFESGFAPDDLGIPTSFVGDTNSIDWTGDFSTDASYFGIVGGGTGIGSSPAPSGQLMRLVTGGDPSGWGTGTVINPGQPFANKPVGTIDDQGKWWIYAGTGRLFVSDDSKNGQQQSFYGIKEPVDTSTNLPSNTATPATRDAGLYPLQNTSGVEVYANGTIVDPETPSITTFSGLEQQIESMAGWYIDFPTPAGNVGTTRNLGAATLFSQLALFTSYTPSSDSCIAEGPSTLYAVYYKTGTAYPNAGLGNDTSVTITSNNTTVPLTKTTETLETGIATTGSLYNAGGTTQYTINLSTGRIKPTKVQGVTTPSGRQSWREIIEQ